VRSGYEAAELFEPLSRGLLQSDLISMEVWNWVVTRDWRLIGPLLFTAAVSLFIFWRQNKLDEKIEQIQSRQAEALESVADSLTQLIKSASPPAKTATPPAMLSARFVGSGTSHQLVVENLGPGEADVMSIDALNAPNLLIGNDLGNGRHLYKGDAIRILAAPSLATPGVVNIGMTWLDSEGGQYRVQALDL
jgi:hypothetical protein